MQIPVTIILLSLSIILLVIYIILHWLSYVPIPQQNEQPPLYKDKKDCPAFSIVIITHDSDYMLEQLINNLVSQEYPNFEILIVNNASTDDTNDVIRRVTDQHPDLIRHTYLPQNRNGILHMAIATTLGVRAARNEWIILLKPNSFPKSALWLSSIAQAIKRGAKLCIGYNDYCGFDNSNWVSKAIKWRRKSQILNFRAINRGKCKPIETENSNLVFSKKSFLDNGGYGRWLSLKNFHENLYVTSFYKSKETAFLSSPEAQVETILPPIEDLWNTDRSIMKKSYHKFNFKTKLRRIHYTLIGCVYILAVFSILLSIYFTLYPLSIDNSSNFLDFSTTYYNIPIAITTLTTAFIIISLIQFLCKIHYNSCDKAKLRTNRCLSPKSFLAHIK